MTSLKTLAVSACFVAAASWTATASANLLTNPGFESPVEFDFSNTDNWNGFFGGPADAQLLANNDTGAPAFNGNAALEIQLNGTQAGNGTNAFVGHVQNVSGLTGETDYTLSTWARNLGSSLTGNVEFRIEFQDASGTEISRDQANLEDVLTDTYQLFSRTVTTPAGTTQASVVFAVASFNQDVPHSNAVAFDDVSLVPEPATAALLGLGGLAMLRRRDAK
ncbi:MAG: PEP-CTERM sorting domain-containing protein [Planctomycetota bacterium]